MLHSVDPLPIILFSLSLSYLSIPYSSGLIMILFSSHIGTCNNNFGTIRFLEWPYLYTLKSILYWLFHNFRVLYISIIERWFYTWTYLYMSTPLWNTRSHYMACYDIFSLYFISTEPADISFLFDIKYFRKWTEWFSCTSILYRY